MNGKKCCLSRRDAFKLAAIVGEWKSQGLARFAGWAEAEAYFTAALGVAVTRYTLEGVCRDSGLVVDDVVEIARRGRPAVDESSRLDEIERRLSALETLFSGEGVRYVK